MLSQQPKQTASTTLRMQFSKVRKFYLRGFSVGEQKAKRPQFVGFLINQKVSNEKNPGWLGNIGDYTTQVYRDYNKPL